MPGRDFNEVTGMDSIRGRGSGRFGRGMGARRCDRQGGRHGSCRRGERDDAPGAGSPRRQAITGNGAWSGNVCDASQMAVTAVTAAHLPGTQLQSWERQAAELKQLLESIAHRIAGIRKTPADSA